MSKKQHEIVLEYLRGRIKELEKEGKEAISIHGMPSYQLHIIENRMSVLMLEVEVLEKKNPKYS